MINNDRKWYIVQVMTGYEQKVKEDLENRDFDKADIGEIFLPLNTSISKTKRVSRRPMYPGYLYVNVDMTDDSWFIIRNTNYVTGIVGSSGQRTKPTPLSEEKILDIKEKVAEQELKIKNISENNKTSIITNVNFGIGDNVKINEGEFINNEGKVLNILIETQKAEVELEVFGRKTKVELDLKSISKI